MRVAASPVVPNTLYLSVDQRNWSPCSNRKGHMPATTAQIVHLLNRVGTRVDPTRVASLTGLELVDIVNDVCDLSKNPPLYIPTVAEYTDAQGNVMAVERAWSIIDDWMDRLATLPNALEAKLTLFWHSHFAVSDQKVANLPHTVNYYVTLAKLGAGSFEALCQAVAMEPAMLVYLDNRTNVALAPQENFARELMELFVLGLNNGYTQNDVREVARAWTGYAIDQVGTTEFSAFLSGFHDSGNKTIFGITKKWKGPEVITEMCTGSRKQQAAEHLASKLWSFFAYESPESSLVSALAAEYLAVGLNTIEFLKKMFLRPEFYSARAVQGRNKSPVEWCAMLLAATGMKAKDTQIRDQAGFAGQHLFYPPNVAGWKLNDVWLNEAEFWALDTAAKDVAYRLLSADYVTPATRTTFAALTNLSVSESVDFVAKQFGLMTLSAVTRQALERWLTQYRANGWDGEVSSLIRLVALSIEARLS
jgi:uncharacterized protein (DUF1800 family)